MNRSIQRLVALGIPNPVRTRGFLLHYDTRIAAHVRTELAVGIFEDEMRSLIETLLHPGMTMIDLGANIGYFSLVGARSVGSSGRVYAFEPDPVTFAILDKNVRASGLHDVIRTINKAVTDTEGTVLLFRYAVDSGMNNLYRGEGGLDTGVMVSTTSLDSFFEKDGWAQVHLIKVDIEGAETAAFAGMHRLVGRNPSLVMIVEFNPWCLRNAGVTHHDFFDSLMRLGFKRIHVVEARLEALQIPGDIPRLNDIWSAKGQVNLLCRLG